jgi:hypothetical protein
MCSNFGCAKYFWAPSGATQIAARMKASFFWSDAMNSGELSRLLSQIIGPEKTRCKCLKSRTC